MICFAVQVSFCQDKIFY